jgi:uncharacterized protein
MTKKRVIIIGAGPAGLAAAFILSKNKALEIILIEKGKKVLERKCPSSEKCINCKKCDKISGIGGAGCYSDGKFIFETLIGKREIGSNLSEVFGEKKEREYIIKSKKMFEYYMKKEISFPKKEILKEAKEIHRIASQNDMDYIFALETHIGTDLLPKFIYEIEKSLINKNVKIIANESVLSFNKDYVISEKNKYKYDYLIIAPGRSGSTWFEEQLQKNEIEYDYRAIDVGFRIETDAEVTRKLTSINRDVKLIFRVPWNGDLIRTFCVCPNGFVTRETYEEQGFNLVNGASDSKSKTQNTNFALLMSIPLTHKANCNSYGEAIAKLFFKSGKDKPVLQRLGDMQNNRKSKEEKIFEWRIKPTLKDVHIGDIGFGMPYRIQNGLLWAIKNLDDSSLMKGLNQSSTLIYAPEIKRYGLKIKTNEFLETTMKNVFVAGDGSGFTRGIVSAAASGILAAEGILKRIP